MARTTTIGIIYTLGFCKTPLTNLVFLLFFPAKIRIYLFHFFAPAGYLTVACNWKKSRLARAIGLSVATVPFPWSCANFSFRRYQVCGFCVLDGHALARFCSRTCKNCYGVFAWVLIETAYLWFYDDFMRIYITICLITLSLRRCLLLVWLFKVSGCLGYWPVVEPCGSVV